MPGKHTAKQKRQAKHVAASERARGMSPKRAESVGWATVNKQKKTRKSFDVISLDEAHARLRKDMGGGGGEVKPQVSATPFNRRRAPKETVRMKPITNAEAAANLRAGKFHEKSLTLGLTQLARALRKARR